MIKIEVVPTKSKSKKVKRTQTLHYAEFILRFPINCSSTDEKYIRQTLQRMCEHIFNCSNPEELAKHGISTYFSASKGLPRNLLKEQNAEIIDTNGDWIAKKDIK